MLRYVGKRGIGAVGLLLIVSFLTFFILHLIPGDAAQIKLGIDGSPEALTEIRRQMGLNQPWYIQYLDWLGNFLTGNFGLSATYGQSVFTLIMQRLPVTLSLIALTMLISVAVALPMGVWSAVKVNGWIDRFSQTFLQTGLAIPSFWAGILLILAFSVYLPIFPPGGYTSYEQGVVPYLQSLFLPALSLAIVEIGILTRMVRVSMLQVLQQDYIRFALSKGISPYRLYIMYGLKNALIAPVTLMGLQISGLLGGAIVIEEVFALPGIGRLLLVAVQQRDIVLLQGITIFVTFAVIVVNFLIDLIYSRLDPRIELT